MADIMRISALLACMASLWLTLPAAQAAVPQGAAHQAFEQAIASAKAAMMADPQAALPKTEAALRAAAALSGPEREIARATALWLKIEANIGLNRLDVAAEFVPVAIGLAQTHAPNSKLLGDLFRARGAIAGLNGNAPAALKDYLAAHRIFRAAKEVRSQAIALQDIGLIYLDAGDYERTLAYFEEAQDLYDDDPGFSLSGNNNRGEAYRALGRLAEAETAYTAALANARALESPLLETRILTNLALVQVDQGKLAAAARNADLAQQSGSDAEARDWLPFVFGVKAAIAARQGDDAAAATLLTRTFAGVDLTKSDVMFKEFHQLAAAVLQRLGQPALALEHQQAFHRLDRETSRLTASASSQLLAAQFDSANQKTRIAQLKQGQLERDVRLAQQRNTLFTVLLGGALCVLLVLSIAFVSIRRSRNDVRDANIVLTDVNAELETALKAKADFLAMTSHEIRTPLNGIMGMTQVILADTNVDTATRERVELVFGAGKAMQSLVDDLLDVAKMQNSDIAIDLAPFDPADMLRETFRFWEDKAAEKGLAINVDLANLPPTIFSDRKRLRQVADNLLANAIKFTAAGSISLTARMDGDAALELRVTDSGIGIPHDQLDQIFEPFHQVDSAMSRQHSGAGLGLSICRNILTALGGQISVTSRPNQGSCFTVRLPLAAAPAATQDHRAPTLASARLLLVDANELRRSKLKAVLEKHCSDIVSRANAADAQAMIAGHHVDALVIDANSVAASGQRLAALSTIIAAAKVAKRPVILLLDPEGELTIESVTAMAPDQLLLRPFTAAALVTAAGLCFGAACAQARAA